MTPYADFMYFGILLYPVIPAAVLGLLGITVRWWFLVATVPMLILQYWDPLQIGPHTAVQEIWILVGYALFQLILAEAFLWLRPRFKSRWPAYVVVILSILPLAAAKWLPLIAPHYVLGFVGISYLTFRSLDVLFGIQDKLITRLPVEDFLAYLLFFPTISSGPIDRFRRFSAEWHKRRTREEARADLDGGIHRIFTGFLYKFIIAFLLKKYWLDAQALRHGFWPTLAYMYTYSFYLFFDFAGYSNFAVGFSYLFGIHPPENFKAPFLAQNIHDFWNRWHISLSFWFRDHVYMRFVMAATRGKWFRNRYLASSLGFVFSMGLMGIWHGTQWYYILYGFYHAGLMIGYDYLNRWNKKRKLWGDGPAWRAAGTFITFNFVCFGLLLFSGRLAG